LIGSYRAHQRPRHSLQHHSATAAAEQEVNTVKQSIFYFDSLDTNPSTTTQIKNVCVRDGLSNFYGKGGGGGGGGENIEILKPINFGIAPQNKQTSTCGLYCIYMAHIIYLDAETNYVTEDGILQFAQEHFNKKFVKHFLYL